MPAMESDKGIRVLLIEDEPGLRLTLCDRLVSEGYSVVTAADGEQGFLSATSEPFDLILLDLMLPKKGGFEICEELRQKGFATPLLMLTARDQVVDKVRGLKIGADDYLTKPFEMIELLARMEALLRRVHRISLSEPAQYHFGSVLVDFRRTQVFRNGTPLVLSAKEFQLLRFLIENHGATVTRETLLQEVWGYTSTPFTRTVDVHVAWLRQKIEEDPRQPQWIVTVHGLGYQFTG
jgi:two-component system, OmpR family, alkaline phosphatase synthesis response regulator PhoP